MKRLILIVCLLLLFIGCASWQEMGETGKPPVAMANRYKATMEIACGNGLGRESWNWILDIVHMFVPLTASWDPRCEDPQI